ncbi:MAG: DUF3857 domain-containing protein [Bacteroidetes bacterium]|nr:DUF3857 domain-containing protein [Bacteroidota bacterium]
MTKGGTILFLVAILSFKGWSGNGEYAVSRIPAPLLKNANVVKRTAVTDYEIFSMIKARLYEKYAITILNEAGDRYASFYKYYDKLRSIKSIDGKLFNAEGREIKSVKNKDVKDYSAVSSISLMEDSRTKVHDFFYKNYPYTVAYEVITEFNNTYVLPDWFPQPAEFYAVEKAVLSLKLPAWYSLKYKMINYTRTNPVVENNKGEKEMNWEVDNLPALVNEYAAPHLAWRTTCVFLSPEKFEIAGYNGSLSAWKEMGLFQLELNRGRDQLPDAVKQKVHALKTGIHDSREKVKVLYEYLQKNTRYISIQLGIGGLQPFDASYVAKISYGDCKALSNYMLSLLKEAGIKSYYTLIRSGRGEYFFTPDFPQDPFNHIILCVPFVKDTMWLECTSQTLPGGYLGGHTDNRYALLVTEEGGILVRTPKYGLNENLEIRNIKAVLDADATLEVKVTTLYTGIQQDDYHSLINNLSKEKVKEALNEQLDFPTYDISHFEYTETKTALPAIEEKLDIVVSTYATITGKRLFIVPNIMTRHNRKLQSTEDRKYDIELTLEYKDVDTVEISLPPGYMPEAMPKDVSLSTKFGKYECRTKLENDKLYYYRVIEHYSGRFPFSDYTELVKFYEAIYKADRSKVVLVKKEN